MPMLKEWEAHFRDLSKQRLYELQDALSVLLADPLVDNNYHSDFYTLKLSIASIANAKELLKKEEK